MYVSVGECENHRSLGGSPQASAEGVHAFQPALAALIRPGVRALHVIHVHVHVSIIHLRHSLMHTYMYMYMHGTCTCTLHACVCVCDVHMYWYVVHVHSIVSYVAV